MRDSHATSLGACRGVFFDLYGTLLPYGDMQAAWNDWFAAFHTHLTDAGHVIDRDRLARALDGFIERPDPPDGLAGDTLFERRVVRVCAELDLHPTDAEVAALSDAAVAAWQRHVPPDPLAADVLAQLAASRRLALVSNFDHGRHIHRLLHDLALREHFDAVVVSGEVGVKKPDPRIFDVALEATGLRPDEVAYVGDADVDVDAARAAGIRPIRIRRPLPPSSAYAHDFRHDRQRGPSADPPARVGDGVAEIRCLTDLLAWFCSR